MVMAIGEPEEGTPTAIYKNHTNCVVFACKGGRSLPSMLAGGDLDGDEYLLITEERLHPPKEYDPLTYGAPQLETLHRDATIDDIADFVVNYINNDILGLIATQQLIMADKSEQILADANCIILAGRYFITTLYNIVLRGIQNYIPLPSISPRLGAMLIYRNCLGTQVEKNLTGAQVRPTMEEQNSIRVGVCWGTSIVTSRCPLFRRQTVNGAKNADVVGVINRTWRIRLPKCITYATRGLKLRIASGAECSIMWTWTTLTKTRKSRGTYTRSSIHTARRCWTSHRHIHFLLRSGSPRKRLWGGQLSRRQASHGSVRTLCPRCVLTHPRCVRSLESPENLLIHHKPAGDKPKGRY